MRVFVVGTGRCGTMSFAKACGHFTNFTAAHETQTADLSFPDQHIESSAPLQVCLFELVDKYPDAFFVHLWRMPDTCVPSLARCMKGDIMRAFSHTYHQVLGDDLLIVAARYYRFANESINLFLKHNVSSDRQMKINMESAWDRWPVFIQKIGAEGDLAASRNSWKTKFNTAEERGEI